MAEKFAVYEKPVGIFPYPEIAEMYRRCRHGFIHDNPYAVSYHFIDRVENRNVGRRIVGFIQGFAAENLLQIFRTMTASCSFFDFPKP